MLQRWNKMRQKDRWSWLFIVSMLVLGGYGLLVYTPTNKALEQSNSKISRIEDRISKRTVVRQVTTGSAVVIERKLLKSDKSRDQLADKLEILRARFTDEADAEAAQAMLLDISILAESSGLSIRKKGTGRVEIDRTRPPVPLIDIESGRAMMIIHGIGSYWAVLEFLDGLQHLSFVSAPLDIKLEAMQPEARNLSRKAFRLPPGVLDITLTLTL